MEALLHHMRRHWIAFISTDLEMTSHSCQFIQATVVDALL